MSFGGTALIAACRDVARGAAADGGIERARGPRDTPGLRVAVKTASSLGTPRHLSGRAGLRTRLARHLSARGPAQLFTTSSLSRLDGVTPLVALIDHRLEPLGTPRLALFHSVSRGAVRIAVQLDHADDHFAIDAALAARVDGVMADGSHLSLDENMAWTAAVVQRAHAVGASVEARGRSSAAGGVAWRMAHAQVARGEERRGDAAGGEECCGRHAHTQSRARRGEKTPSGGFASLDREPQPF